MPELIHIADPMCSWCYAFGPELRRVVAETGLSVRLVMGGLFVGTRTQVLDDPLRAYLRVTWQRVSEMSGQPVDLALIDRHQWTYNTELACRAVVWCRATAPDRAMPFFEALQRAFYAESKDLTQVAELVEVAEGLDLDTTGMGTALLADRVAEATTNDFARAIDLGATGFPTLLLDTGAEQIPVATGYTPASQVLRVLRAFT